MRGEAVEEFQIGVDVTVEQLRELAPGAMSAPQIFKDGVLIGGFRELQKTFNVGP